MWDKTNKPSGLCSSLDMKSISKGDFPFGSPIFNGTDDIPKRSAADVKAKAINPYEWQMKHFAAIENPAKPAWKRHNKGLMHEQNIRGEYDEFAEYESYYNYADQGDWYNQDNPKSQDGKPTPHLNRNACSIVMGLLYAFRVCRFDVLRICCKLATRFTKWEEIGDKRLLRLMRYVNCTLHHRQIGFIGDDEASLFVNLFCLSLVSIFFALLTLPIFIRAIAKSIFCVTGLELISLLS